jgi:mono/diheme cytochrome c family protein
MSRPVKLLSGLVAVAATALASAACGTERISVPASQSALHRGAVLFQQRCAGCHSLAQAATFGSAANVFTAEFNNGPDFNVRCERPVTRVLYAIENGGFSGAIMPQNIVVGKDAIDVAKFVATYSGRQAPHIPGQVPCRKKAIGSIPAGVVPTSTSTTQTTASAPSRSSKSTKPTTAHKKTGHQARKRHT